MSEGSLISVTHEGSVTRIVLSRGEKRNALTVAMLEELVAALGGVPASSRAVTLTGEGKAFCAGFDLKACAADPGGGTMRALLTGLSGAVRAMRGLDVPVVLGVHGAAVAGGCALLGGADVVVCERGAVLGYPVVKIGVSPGVSGPFLMGSVARGAARALMLDPGLIGAEKALSVGLVHEVVDGEDALRGRVDAVAAGFAAKPVSGVRATKRLMNELAAPFTDRADEALGVSVSLTGSDEERAMLGKLWA